MFTLKLLRASAFLKAVSSKPVLKNPPGFSTNVSRSLHQQLPRSIQRPRHNLPSVHSRPSHRNFSTQSPFRQQRYRYPPEQDLEPERPRGSGGNNYGYNSAFTPPRYGKYTPILFLSGGGAIIFYFANLETVPVSGRRRFNCFSEASAEQQGTMAYQQIIAQGRHDGTLLPEYDRRVVQVKRVLQRLIEGGELAGDGWEVNVIDQDEANAFVLPGGKVFVFTGILPITGNDSGLAAVLGHEIAHNLAHHSAERMSGAIVVQILVGIAAIAEGLFFGGNGSLSQILARYALDFGVMRPSSRQQESEADYIGLLLMAQSCYDPKDAVGLWERMEKAQKGAPPEWLSTHPSNESRITHITQWLPKAEEKREESGCAATIGYAKDFQQVVGSLW